MNSVSPHTCKGIAISEDALFSVSARRELGELDQGPSVTRLTMLCAAENIIAAVSNIPYKMKRKL
jgi:hypothetical protein